MAAGQVLAILISITSLGASTVGGMYLYSLENFSTMTNKRKGLKEEFNDQTGSKAQELFSSKKEKTSDFSYLFKEIKNQVERNKNTLKEACLKGYVSNYKSIFFEDQTLLRNLNLFCRLRIRDLFDSKNIIKTDMAEDSNLFTKVKEVLKKHDEGSMKKIQIGQIMKTGKYEGQTYKNWCKKGYDSYFEGEEDKNGKLANQYCKKSNFNKSE